MPPKRGSGLGHSTTTDPEILAKRKKGRQIANERMQVIINAQGTKKIEDESLSFSSIPQVLLINQKNYYTNYLKKDENFLMLRDNEKKGDRTLAIHPGGHNIKIGWVDDVDPIYVPNYVGYIKRKNISFEKKGSYPEKEEIDGISVLKDEKFKERMKDLFVEFKERMKAQKKRVLPNCHEACFNFNLKQKKEEHVVEEVEEVNEVKFIKAKKWFEKTGKDYVVGEEVFRLHDEEEWNIRSPFCFKEVGGNELGFNDINGGYFCREEILGDIEILIRHSLEVYFEVKKREEIRNINIVLIIPTLYRKSYVESMMEILLERMEFNEVCILPEGMAATYGVGLSSGCIVDIGHNGIHICCIDEGIVVDDSCIVTKYGIESIIKIWSKLLISQQFPIDINLNKRKDFKIMEDTFKTHVTLDDSKGGSIAVGGVILPISKRGIKRYQFKIFDESMIAPMSLFKPEVFRDNEKEEKEEGEGEGKEKEKMDIKKSLFNGKSSDFKGYENEDPKSKLTNNEGDLRDKNLIEAIIASINESGNNSSKMWSNIVIVGGGASIEQIDNIIAEKLINSGVVPIGVTIDVSVGGKTQGGGLSGDSVCWKGGCVMGRIGVSGVSVHRRQWSVLGERALVHGSVVQY
ncbi:hypothetical protein CANINC_001084 [Pichia inconspicua]|uniref:Uncharacterized protein n=1 Tax=Pichia inconspicua TaxID=52247 RepID=A0A4T0X5W2_9ASCO|nr:hypothetical protein CANINC_001084 [[Candida] inconspicua]